MKLMLIAMGGAAGSLLRYGVARLFPIADWPLATLMVNIAGSFLIGMLAGGLARLNWPEELWLAGAVGLCGGFTTFSSFSLENIRLLESGHYLKAVSYITASVVLSLMACYFGKKIVG